MNAGSNLIKNNFNNSEESPNKRIKTEHNSDITEYEIESICEAEQLEGHHVFPTPVALCESRILSPGTRRISTTSDYQERVISLLETIVSQNQMIIDRLSQYEGFAPHQQSTADFPLTLPLETENDMNVLEEFLSVNQHFDSLVAHFSTFGGKDALKATNSMLNALMTDTLATQYSYKGMRAGKKAFVNLAVNSVIIRAVTNIIRGSTFKDVEDVIKNWLKHSSDRIKVKERKKSNAANQNTEHVNGSGQQVTKRHVQFTS